MDNLSSHTRKAVVQRFGAKAGSWLWDRFTMYYTRKHASWLNQAEIASVCLPGNAWASAGSENELLCADKVKLEPAYESPSHSDPMGIFSRKPEQPLATQSRGHGIRYPQFRDWRMMGCVNVFDKRVTSSGNRTHNRAQRCAGTLGCLVV
jgi:hypothetical protein